MQPSGTDERQGLSRKLSATIKDRQLDTNYRADDAAVSKCSSKAIENVLKAHGQHAGCFSIQELLKGSQPLNVKSLGLESQMLDVPADHHRDHSWGKPWGNDVEGCLVNPLLPTVLLRCPIHPSAALRYPPGTGRPVMDPCSAVLCLAKWMRGCSGFRHCLRLTSACRVPWNQAADYFSLVLGPPA